jgi:hypothetical protein
MGQLRHGGGISRYRVGQWGWPGAVNGGGDAPGSSGIWEEERADRWGPLDSKRRERREPAWKPQTKKGNTFPRRRHQHMGQMSLRGRLGRHGQSWASWAEPRREFKWNLILNFKFRRTLRNFTRWFRRNLYMGIFPKFF